MIITIKRRRRSHISYVDNMTLTNVTRFLTVAFIFVAKTVDISI